MWAFLCPNTKPLALPRGLANVTTPPVEMRRTAVEGDPMPDISGEAALQNYEIFTGYTSEDSTDDVDDEDEPAGDNERKPESGDSAPVDDETPRTVPIAIPQISGFGMLERKRRRDSAKAAVPALKRHKHETPVRLQRNRRKN